MYRSSTNKDVKKKTSSSPIRVVIRLAWSGARLTVPTTNENNDPLPPIRASSTTLLDLILRLESALPPSLFQDGGNNNSTTTLVCLRKVVPQSQWEQTTLQQMLDGDDGSAGVVLTLDLGAGSAVSSISSSSAAVRTNPLTNAISSAASLLNIKPAVATAPPVIDLTSTKTEPMEITKQDDDATRPPISFATPQPANIERKMMSHEHAWNQILQSNFDATSKDCLHALLKIVDNLLSRPNDPKVRSIRCANAAFDKKVGSIVGGYDFLFSIGFVPKYPPALHSWGTTASLQQPSPEMLELTPEHESREILLQARAVLIQSAIVDLGTDENDLPPAPKLSPAPSTLAAPLVNSSSRQAAADSTSGFNVYKTHSYNIQSAALGAPDPYGTGSTMSITERQLKDLESKKEKLEREMQANIEKDRGLVAYRDGSGPVRMDAATPASSATAASGEGKSDSSLVAARMKRIEEERRKREEGGFTTKAMRDLEKMKKAKVRILQWSLMLHGMLHSLCIIINIRLSSTGVFTCSDPCQLFRRGKSSCQIPTEGKGLYHPLRNQIRIPTFIGAIFRL